MSISVALLSSSLVSRQIFSLLTNERSCIVGQLGLSMWNDQGLVMSRVGHLTVRGLKSWAFVGTTGNVAQHLMEYGFLFTMWLSCCRRLHLYQPCCINLGIVTKVSKPIEFFRGWDCSDVFASNFTTLLLLYTCFQWLTSIASLATSFVHIVAIIMTAIMILHIRSKYTAVGKWHLK